MHRWRATVLAALAAVLPVLASDLHGWPHVLLAAAIGSVAAAVALPSKKTHRSRIFVVFSLRFPMSFESPVRELQSR